MFNKRPERTPDQKVREYLQLDDKDEFELKNSALGAILISKEMSRSECLIRRQLFKEKLTLLHDDNKSTVIVWVPSTPDEVVEKIGQIGYKMIVSNNTIEQTCLASQKDHLLLEYNTSVPNRVVIKIDKVKDLDKLVFETSEELESEKISYLKKG